MGLVGSARKRTLMLWQAVELSRSLERPDLVTLQIARKALEPPEDPREHASDESPFEKRRPLSAGVPKHWPSVRCGCIEGDGRPAPCAVHCLTWIL